MTKEEKSNKLYQTRSKSKFRRIKKKMRKCKGNPTGIKLCGWQLAYSLERCGNPV